MTRPLRIVLTAAAVFAAPMTAQAASAATRAVYPSVSSVSPKRVAVGGTMTIRGKGFRSGKNRNTVVFQRTGKPAVFVRVASATATRLTFLVPGKLAPFLATKGGAAVPTRFRLRVLSARFARSFTTSSLSPVITPKATTSATGTGAGTGTTSTVPVAPTCQALAAADPSGDRDGDAIANDREAQIATDPCNADTDGDGIVDGYEYRSAVDLNGSALPYPGKRPWPNPLDPSDTRYDFDGDGLSLSQEYSLWRYVGASFPVSAYSDGTQNSGGRVDATTPALMALDRDGNGIVTDDERDADADGLSNMVEFNLTGTRAWWRLAYPSEQPYSISTFYELDPTNPDTDGDGESDGTDDQDHDGWSNIQEMQSTRAETGYRVQPYNPCLPDPHSRTCSRYFPFSQPWAPFDGSQSPGDAIPFRWPRPTTQPVTGGWDGRGGPQS